MPTPLPTNNNPLSPEKLAEIDAKWREEKWIDYEVAFYDFIWREGLKAHEKCINEEIIRDFRDGGNNFEEMKAKILTMFPTREDAEKAYEAGLADERKARELEGGMKE